MFTNGAAARDVALVPELPAALAMVSEGESYRLDYTGRAERIFLFFKIYEIAHYAQSVEGSEPALTFDTVLSDPRPKAILVRFNRTLGRDRIRDELDQSLRRNAQDDWLQEAQGTIDAFMAAIDRDATAGDALIFYWLPGGKLSVEFNGEPAFATTDNAFAKLIWSIWFGADPACEREGLLAEAESPSIVFGGS